MKLSQEQQKKVEKNMRLVGKVIKDKVHGTNQLGIYSYDDIVQIGYIGLCKAAYTDKGGCFSTYAYRLIWHEISDALICANRLGDREILLSTYNYEAQEEAHFSSFSESLENILARSDSIVNNEGLNIAQAAPTTVTGEAVTFEELINSENEQIREFAVLDQQPLSPDWTCVKNANPVTPSNFKAINGLSDGLMLSQRFANAIYSV